MRRIDKNTLELTPLEAKCHDRYEELLDEGWGCTSAAEKAIKEFREVSFTFQEWLRGDRNAG